jgi:hypothetical protein
MVALVCLRVTFGCTYIAFLLIQLVGSPVYHQTCYAHVNSTEYKHIIDFEVEAQSYRGIV